MKTTKKVAPDGNWGWVACFGVSLVNLATRSIEPSFGLLFGDLLADLNVGTTGAAVIMSALDVMMNFSGLFVGPLLKEFSYRKVALAGSLLCGLGLALTCPANSMTHILITYSVINGIGVGLATSAAFVALNHYFKNKRGQAVGLSMAGTALGMLFIPQLVRVLLEAYGFRGAVLLISGMAFHSAVGSITLQPIKWHLKEELVDIEMTTNSNNLNGNTEIQKEDDEDDLPEMKNLLFANNNRMRKNFSDVGFSNINKGTTNKPIFPRVMSNVSTADMVGNGLEMSIRKRKVSVISHLSQLDFSGSNLQVHMNIGDHEAEEQDQELRRVKTTNDMSSARSQDSFFGIRSPASSFKLQALDGVILMSPKKQTFWRRFAELMNIDILKDPIYLNILFGLSIFYVAEMNFKMVTPFFFANLGYSKADVAFCLSITAITDILARVVLPPIYDRINIRKRTIFLISIIFVAITRSIMAEQTGWTELMVWLSICGFFRGSALSNFTLAVSEHWSLEKLPAAFGWHMIGKALFVIAFGPLIGAIRDLSNSYPLCIHSQTVCIFLCVIAWLSEYLITYIRTKKSSETSVTTSST